MRKFQYLSLAVALVMLAAIFAPLAVFAQDIPPGEGAPIIESNFGGDITTLNPLLVADGASGDVTDFMFPDFIAGDPDTGLPVPNGENGSSGALVTDWEVSEDGTVYTFTLRDDWTWGDGTPITAADVQYAWDALASGDVDNIIFEQLVGIESVVADGPNTVVVTFESASCNALNVAAGLPVVPAHAYQELYPTFADMTIDHPNNFDPPTTAGVFTFSNFRPGEQVTLLDDQNFPDPHLDGVIPQAWVLKQVADQTVAVEQFLDGQITLIDSIPIDRLEQLQELGAQGEINFDQAPSASWFYFYFNLADPTNPQDGVDEDGNPIDQGHHPILGDVRVRQAIAMSIDHDALNEGAFNGVSQPIGSYELPQSWAYNGEAAPPWPFDLEAAAALLDEAGFVDDDGDPETPRVATEDALYAEPGTPLEFTLTAFSGNNEVDASTVLIQDQLRRSGIQMNLDIIEFTSMIDLLFSQEFDAVVLFLGPFDPNDPGEVLGVLGADADTVGGGLNAGSYNNPEFEELIRTADSLPGCDQAERFELYSQAQAIIRNDLPIYLIGNRQVPFVAQGNVGNYDPRPRSLRWNIDAWSIPSS
ncbi:MAG: hypothetical protein D6737_09000 [Chloroflexi bacterium]|nr:MAG: hypothetical protein D6737_09000 [Chloroflexota bacterium]